MNEFERLRKISTKSGKLFVYGLTYWNEVGNQSARIYPLADCTFQNEIKELGGGEIIQLATNQEVSFALDSNFDIWSFGTDLAAVIPNTWTKENIPIRKLESDKKFKQISTGSLSLSAITWDGELHVMGLHRLAELIPGIGSEGHVTTLTRVGTDSDWEKASGGYSFICAIKKDGTLWSWGYNANGTLGLGNTTSYSSPQQVLTTYPTSVPTNSWKDCYSEHYRFMAVDNNNDLYICGQTAYQQLGQASPVPNYLNKIVSDVQKVSYGAYHTFVLKNDNTLWAFGNNANGQLGDGTLVQKYLQQVTMPDGINNDWINVWCGHFATFAMKSNGDIYATGYNGCLSLYNKSTADVTTFTKLEPELNKINNFSSSLHSSGIIMMQKGSIDLELPYTGELKNFKTYDFYARGYNFRNSLGISNRRYFDKFEQITNLKRIKDFDVDYNTCVILTESNKVFVSGQNTIGGSIKIINSEEWVMDEWNEIPLDPSLKNVKFESISITNRMIMLNDRHGNRYIYGNNANGNFGLGHTNQFSYITRNEALRDFEKLSMSWCNSIGITKDFEIKMCGTNANGTFGEPVSSVAQSSEFIKIDILGHIPVECYTWIENTFVINNNGQVLVTGKNSSGELGLGHQNVVRTFTPVDIFNTIRARKIFQSQICTMVLTENGDVYAAGNNSYGCIGLSLRQIYSTFTKVPNVSNIVDIRCSECGSVLIDNQGRFFYSGMGASNESSSSYIFIKSKIPGNETKTGFYEIDIPLYGKSIKQFALNYIGSIFVLLDK